MTKKLFFLTLYLIFSVFKLYAQVTSTEDFETEPANATSFTNNGQTFNITYQAGGYFDIYVGEIGYGWNGTSIDNRFIDNTGTASFNIPLQLTISSSGATPFKLNSMWLFLSQSDLSSLGVGGSLTLVGKLAGVTQYTATSNSGFNTSMSVANGFTLINLSNFGGQNNANTVIDQIVISTGGSFAYISVDAFTWTTVTALTTDSFDNTNFSFYPNPTSNILNIEYAKNIESVSVINMLGQTLFENKTNNTNVQIDLSNLPTATYFVKVKADGNEKTVKVVKQ